MAIFDCRVEDLYVPLMSLINYRGYSLIAQSWLPIGSQTIVYGTSDGGENIYATNDAFNAKMKAVGQQVNIKPHSVWNKSRTYRTLMYGPADLEGHIGTDHRAYVLDCSRLFPPCAPDKSFVIFLASFHILRFIRTWDFDCHYKLFVHSFKLIGHSYLFACTLSACIG